MYSKNNFKTAKKKLIQDLKFFLLISFASALLITNVYAEDFEINHADSLEVGENSLNIKGNIKIKYKEYSNFIRNLILITALAKYILIIFELEI